VRRRRRIRLVIAMTAVLNRDRRHSGVCFSENAKDQADEASDLLLKEKNFKRLSVRKSRRLEALLAEEEDVTSTEDETEREESNGLLSPPARTVRASSTSALEKPLSERSKRHLTVASPEDQNWQRRENGGCAKVHPQQRQRHTLFDDKSSQNRYDIEAVRLEHARKAWCDVSPQPVVQQPALVLPDSNEDTSSSTKRRMSISSEGSMSDCEELGAPAHAATLAGDERRDSR